MPVKYPIDYDLSPSTVAGGMHWLTLRVRNIGAEPLANLDVRLNSLDAYSISVQGMGQHIPLLNVNEQQQLPFQVRAKSTSSLYATIDGWLGTQSSHWESLPMVIRVGTQVAELANAYAMTDSYPSAGDTIPCQATVRAFGESEQLALELWVNSPSGKFRQVARTDVKGLSAGEEASYPGEITVQEKGTHTLYAYLYENGKRIGRKTDLFYVT